MLTLAALTTLFAATVLVRADANPTAPGPGDSFKVGASCPITWEADPTGKWTTMFIELMTGDNFNMVHLTTVGQFDGTDKSNTSYSWPCPNVTPNSAIYFYQFSSPAGTTDLWTTRFTIAGADGSSTAPPNATQPDGKQIGWGVGAFVDPSQASPAPSGNGTTAAGSGTTSSTSGSASASGTASLPGGVSVTGAPSTTAVKVTTDAAKQTTSGADSAQSTTPTNSGASRVGASVLALGASVAALALAL